MSKYIIYVLLVTVSLAWSADGQVTALTTFNGEIWQVLKPEDRINHMTGYVTGASKAVLDVTIKSNMKRLEAGEVTKDELSRMCNESLSWIVPTKPGPTKVAEMLTEFYKNRQNWPILLTDACTYLARQEVGATQVQLENFRQTALKRGKSHFDGTKN